MKAVPLADSVYRIGANLQKEELFEGIWPTPFGVSVNSYLINGDKKVLIDFIADKPAALQAYEAQLNALGTSFEAIDCLILNHMEPDHTGSLAWLKERNPKLTLFCTQKAAALVQGYYNISDSVQVVTNGDTLDIGGGKSLIFYETPNIHWPETMMSYYPEAGILFSCDAFGSFGAIDDDKIFDDQLSADDADFVYHEALRYYANIISSFSPFVLKGIEKLANLPIRMVAPSHGPVWRSHPEIIIQMYSEFASYYKGTATPSVTVIWSSMYGNTEKMLKPVLRALEEQQASYSVFKIPRDHASFVLADAWKSQALIIGMPTYEYKMFPPMAHLLDLFDRSHVCNKTVFRFGSYGWSGGAQKQFDELTSKLNWTYLDPVEWQGAPSETDLENGYRQTLQLLNSLVR